MRISDWSSDVCSSDLRLRALDKETPPEFCDWFAMERIDGRDIDVGLYRHWLDPSRPFAASLGQSAHGMLTTSATRTDKSGGRRRGEAVHGAEARKSTVQRQRVSVPADLGRLTTTQHKNTN